MATTDSDLLTRLMQALEKPCRDEVAAAISEMDNPRKPSLARPVLAESSRISRAKAVFSDVRRLEALTAEAEADFDAADLRVDVLALRALVDQKGGASKSTLETDIARYDDALVEIEIICARMENLQEFGEAITADIEGLRA